MTSADTRTASGRKAATEPEAIALIFVAPDLVQRVLLKAGDSISAGRVTLADVVLDHPSVSRLHARFTFDEGGVQVEDTDSKNGVTVDGKRITTALVGAGQRLLLGEVEVWIGSGGTVREPEVCVLGASAFAARLDEELQRIRYSGRPVHLLAIHGVPAVDDRTWLSNIAQALRPVDRITEHAPHLLLALLVERDASEALAFVELVRQRAGLPTGAALASVFSGPTGAESLLSIAIDGCLRTALGAPTLLLDAVSPVVAADAPVVVSPLIQRLFDLATRTSHADIPLLISGETGAGKEVVARAFHERSHRAGQPFCEINCGAIAPTLLESVLFGHEKGAFSGADKRTLGLFEQAEGGTLFLDEVGELSHPAQSALLRVLESKRLRRVGGTQEIPFDVRVIAATHRNLRSMVTKGEFREDLLYRLEGLTVGVPPLRERLEEIDPLCDRFLSFVAAKWNTAPRQISATARQAIRRYPWPGNVRQLRNAIERAAVVCEGLEIQLDDLPEYLFDDMPGGGPTPVATKSVRPSGPSLSDEVREFELARIVDALDRAKGNRAEAARMLGLPRRTLGSKIKGLGLE